MRRQTDRAKQDPEDRQANAVGRAAGQGAGGGEKPTTTFSGRIEFLEKRRQLRRHRGNEGARRRSVGIAVSCQRWQSIFRKCDLPLPKKPLTHAPFWLVWLEFARNDSMMR